MAFITQGTTFFSFADYEDVVARDSRLFSTNEGLTPDVVEETLIRSTTRILDMLRSSAWWKSYYIRQTGSTANIIVGQSIEVPALNPFLQLEINFFISLQKPNCKKCLRDNCNLCYEKF